MRLHFRKVEIWSGASLDELGGIMEEVQTEIEETTRDGLPIHSEVLLFQMPTSRSCDESGQYSVSPQFVLFFSLYAPLVDRLSRDVEH